MYVIVLKGRVIAGPMDWNGNFFKEILTRNGVDCTLNSTPPDVLPMTISQDVVAYKAELVFPEHNPKIEYVHGPFWDYTTGVAVGTFEVKDIPIDLIKGTLKERIAAVRYKEEIAGTTVTVQGIEVSVATDRQGRTVYLQQLGIMSDSDTVAWKFKEQWLTLTKSDLQTIVNTINLYVQNCFASEYQKSQSIDAATTAAELDAIVLGDEPQQTGMPA